MINFKRPLLAAALLKPTDVHDDETILAAMKRLRYPVLATLKKDGIRAIKLDNLYSRTLKLIPNRSIRERAMKLPAGFDMELWNMNLEYDEVESIVMSKTHPHSDQIQFHILDNFSTKADYQTRMWRLKQNVSLSWPDVSCENPRVCQDAAELYCFFHKIENQEGEGICFRTPNSPYKQGRSTLKEQYLVKLARMLQSEAIIEGFEEQMENANSPKHNAIGMMDRSSCKDSMYGKDTLGALYVRDTKTNQSFKVGTGFTDKTRKLIWESKPQFLGRIIMYNHKPHGQKLLPRCPSYKGLREKGF